MEIEIKKLTVDLLDDWLRYFDSAVYFNEDDAYWPGCYCMHFHWNKELDNKNDWNASVEQEYKKTGKADNRERAIRLIKNGTMQGYLAYHAGKVIGWCNANDKHRYRTVLDSFFDNADPAQKVKSIVCFCVAAQKRKMGVATMLLEKVCADATAEGYEYVEAYPYSHGQANDFQGPLSMYKKMGFEKTGRQTDDCIIMRKACNTF